MLLQPLLSKGMQLAVSSSSLLPALNSAAFSSVPTAQNKTGAVSQSSAAAQALNSSCSKSFAAGYASSTEVTPLPAGENSWSKFRAPYGIEQKSSLGTAMYLSIAVFGFSMYLNDVIYHPPRVVTMLGLVTLLLYVRRR